MKRFEFPYVVDPWVIFQEWGVFNPAFYSQFGFSRHNGIDIAIGLDKLIRAPFAGTVIRTGNQPTGGGIFLGVLSDDFFSFDDGINACVLADFLHCEKLLVQEGQHVIKGQPLAIQGNTGFSTGPHTHIQLRRETKVPAPQDAPNSYRLIDGDIWLIDVDKNDANNSFDPTPYYTKTFVLTEELNAIQKAINTIAELIKSIKGRV